MFYIVSGTGVALVNICCSTAIVRVFKGKQRSMCLSIAYSAPALSSVVYPNLITWFLNMYGLPGTWLLIGGLFLHSWPLPILIYFYRPLMDYHHEDDKAVSSTKEVYMNDALYEDIGDKTFQRTTGYHEAVVRTNSSSSNAVNSLDESGGYDNEAIYDELDDITYQITDADSTTHPTNNLTINMTSDFERSGYLLSTHDLKGKVADNVKDRASTPDHSLTTSNDKSIRFERRFFNQGQTGLCKNAAVGRILSIFKNKPYITLVLGASFIMGTCNAYVALVFDIAAGKEFSSSQTLLLFIPYSICCTLSRLVPGALEQFKGVNSYIFPLTIIALAIGAQALILYTSMFALFVVGVCLIGLASGGALSSVVVLSMNIVRPDQQAMASGMLFTLMGVLSTVFTPLFGK